MGLVPGFELSKQPLHHLEAPSNSMLGHMYMKEGHRPYNI